MIEVRYRGGCPFVDGLSHNGQRQLEEYLRGVSEVGIRRINRALKYVSNNPNKFGADVPYIEFEIKQARTQDSGLPHEPTHEELRRLAKELFELTTAS